MPETIYYPGTDKIQAIRVTKKEFYAHPINYALGLSELEEAAREAIKEWVRIIEIEISQILVKV